LLKAYTSDQRMNPRSGSVSKEENEEY